MEKKCNNCKNGIKSFNCDSMNNFEPIVRTNRQWLESLSDEELAKEFDEHNTCCYCVYKGEKCTEHTEYDCKKGILDWLQAEHKE